MIMGSRSWQREDTRVTQVYYLGIVTWGWALCGKVATPTLACYYSKVLQPFWGLFSEYAPPVCPAYMRLISSDT